MSTHPRSGAPAPTTIVVTDVGATPYDVRRCLTEIMEGVPAETRIVAITRSPLPLSKAQKRRVHHQLVGRNGVTAAAQREAVQDHTVLVVPAAVAFSGTTWLQLARLRMMSQPRLTGVVDVEGAYLFAFPAAVTTTDGPQNHWASLDGVGPRRPRPATATAPVRAGRQTLSAVLIVKDEELVLEACLQAVTPFVDQVVVYDTGSSDRTLEIARQYAGTVVEGYWNEDFAAARNRALTHATGDWVLSLDADEVIKGDVAAVRAFIEDAHQVDSATVSIISTAWSGAETGDESRSTRMFRRERCRWRGALHEQVVEREGQPPLRWGSSQPPLQLIHSGYDAATLAVKGKRTRNAAISKAALDALPASSPLRPDALTDYGRSLFLEGRPEEALVVLTSLLDTPASSGNMVQAARVAVPLLIRLRRTRHVGAWLTAAEEHGESGGQLLLWRAGAALVDGDVDEAESLLAGLDDQLSSVDVWGKAFDPDAGETMLAEVDLFQGRDESAAARMRAVLQRSPHTVSLQTLVNALGASGLTMRDLIDEAPEEFLDRSLRDMAALPPGIALPWFSAFSAARPDDYRPVVAGCAVAAHSSWLDALEWSARAREHGLDGVSALRDQALEQGRSRPERAIAWAFLGHAFGAEDAGAAWRALWAVMDPAERQAARDVVDRHIPEALAELAPGATGDDTAATAGLVTR